MPKVTLVAAIRDYFGKDISITDMKALTSEDRQFFTTELIRVGYNISA